MMVKMLVYVSEWVVSFEKKIYFKDAQVIAGRRIEYMPLHPI